MEQKIATLRDGVAQQLLTRLLVPGDVILLVGGAMVPADVDWIEGDVLSVDTAALTGEPLPRKYPCKEYGRTILCGSTIVAGEAYCVVRKTGANTEIGSSQAAIMQDKTEKKISLFEDRILLAVKVIIFISVLDVIVILLVQGIARSEFAHDPRGLIASCLSIVIASVPVALPLVLQVTMALGAGMMARDYNAVITSLPALQDIASMTVLCSDKTGTLTTAKISIIQDAVWPAAGFTKDDVTFYAGLASNRDKKEDPIDRAVIQHFDRVLPANRAAQVNEYSLLRSVGFNPIYKRVLWQYSHPVHGVVTIVKGLPNKVVDTADGGVDDAADQFKVQNHEVLLGKIHKLDAKLSKAGYKTLGVAIQFGLEAPWQYVGVLPMLDPPRHDTAQTIANLLHAKVKVKMITGDHLNIAKETARLIGLGVNMYKGEEIRDASEIRDETILQADGFAQVLPRDKREVVLVLRNKYHYVVGMTGDGVNDAPALSAAQCGIAVEDATDAAKNAAAIILTTPGLSAIYNAIIESRRIFRKLKSYVIYRFAATIQIVVVLTLLIFISNCPINSFYIVLFALLNDVTLLPIAYDIQGVSATPEYPAVMPILIMSAFMGAMQTGFSMLWAYASYRTNWFKSDFNIFTCTTQAQAGVWVQVFVAAEILIFSARAPTFFWAFLPPSPALFISVFLGCLIVTILACASPFFGNIWVQDAAIIWTYNVICFVIVDALKVLVLHFLGESFEPLKKIETPRTGAETPITGAGASATISAPLDIESQDGRSAVSGSGEDAIVASRASSAVSKLRQWRQLSSTNVLQHAPSHDASFTSGASPSQTISPKHVIIGSNASDLHGVDDGRSLSSSNIRVIRNASHIALIAAKRTVTATPSQLITDTHQEYQRMQQPQQQQAAAAPPTQNAEEVGGGVTTEDLVNVVREGQLSVPPSYLRDQPSTIDLRRTNLSSTNLRPYTPANLRAKR